MLVLYQHFGLIKKNKKKFNTLDHWRAPEIIGYIIYIWADLKPSFLINVFSSGLIGLVVNGSPKAFLDQLGLLNRYCHILGILWPLLIHRWEIHSAK
jgi:hypothetical protein